MPFYVLRTESLEDLVKLLNKIEERCGCVDVLYVSEVEEEIPDDDLAGPAGGDVVYECRALIRVPKGCNVDDLVK